MIPSQYLINLNILIINKRLKVIVKIMGIPRFYRWLRNRYPQIRMDLQDKSKKAPVIDNLYFDFNGLIYRCIRQFQCFLKNKFDPLSFEEIFQKAYEYMLAIVEQTDPQKIIYIAFDGVAPRAKINQSRDRRFKAAKEKQQFRQFLTKIQLADQQNFQQNSISPGTTFLVDLCDRLKKQVMSLIQGQWKHLNVFYSDCLTPGQGQHKIMQFLRQSKSMNLFNENTTHCIYSADADVLLLSLATSIDNIVLIREDSMKYQFSFTAQCQIRKYKQPEFEYVFLNILRQYLSKQFEECIKQLSLKSVQPIINDFILLMAFVGNDFLPTQFCFSMKQSHMEALFNSYKSYLLETKVFINDNGDIDWKNIKRLLEICKQFQATMLEESIKNKRSVLSTKAYNSQNNRQSEQKKTEDKTGEKQQRNRKRQQHQKGNNDDWEDVSNVDEQQVANFEVQGNKITKGRQYYYKKRFDLENIKSDNRYQEIITKYMEGLEFYCQYYFKGVPSWSWFYPYHYTPLIVDIYEFISENNVQIKLNKSVPYDPFMALMLMMPPQSFNLLPNSIKLVMQSEQNKQFMKEYFPQKFRIDPYETVTYNRRALIKFLDEQQVRQIYKKVQRNQYSQQQKDRNMKNNTLLFRMNKGMVQGIQIVFGRKQRQQEIIDIFNKIKKTTKITTKQRFPSLQIFGKYTINEKGRIITTHKYKDDGNVAQLVYFNHFLGYIEEALECTQDYRVQFQSSYQKIGIVVQGKCQKFYRVKQARQVRQIGFHNYIPTNREVYVPDFALFKVPKYQYFPGKYNFQMKQLYEKGQKVAIIGDKKYFGCIGIINEADNSQKASVKLVQPSYIVRTKVQQSTIFINIKDEQQFYMLKSVAQQLATNEKVILAVLDELLLLPKTGKAYNTDIYPMAVNFGLNIINTKQGLICPNYARCQLDHENTSKKQEIFNYIQLSQKCVDILKQYFSKFEYIVDYLEQNIKDSHDYSYKKGIRVNELFSGPANTNMFKDFLKLYQIQAPGYFYSIYSKVCSEQHMEQDLQPMERITATIQIPYSSLISKKQARISAPNLHMQPEFHDIGDRVVILRSLKTGFIVGIDDCHIYVMIKGTSSQKKQQKSKKSQSWAMKNVVKCKFNDVFNQKWESSLMRTQGKGWSMNISYYSPTHYTAAE